MEQKPSITAAEIQALITVLKHEPDAALIDLLMADPTFCSIYSAIKSSVQQHVEQLRLVDTAQNVVPLIVDEPPAIDETVQQVESKEIQTEGDDLPVSQTDTLCGEVNPVNQLNAPSDQGNAPQSDQAPNVLQELESGANAETGELFSKINVGTANNSSDQQVAHLTNEDAPVVSPSMTEVCQAENSHSTANLLSGNFGRSRISLVKVPETVEHNIMNTDQSVAQPAKDRETIHITMPNGMCGREYSQAIPLDNLHIEDSRIPAELGLQFDKDANRVIGVPKQDGDFEIRFQGYLATEGTPEGQPRQDVFVISRFTINPDPRSLWKDLESDSQARFHKPDFASNSMDFGNQLMIAASQRGRSHAHKGTHRDDEAGIRYLADSGWHILAVADGAGSCQYSRRGSQLALETVMQHLSEVLDGEAGKLLESACLEQDEFDSSFSNNTTQALHQTLIQAAWKAAKGIESEAEFHQLNVKDFSTTLLLMIYKRTEKGNLILSFSVGDGAIAAYSKEDGVSLLCSPDSGEFAGQTRFLDCGIFKDQNAYQRIKACLLPHFTALMVMTDGITDARFETEAMLSENAPWQQLWTEIEPLLKGTKEEAEKAVLEWLNFWSPGNHDDRSIALLTGTDRDE